MKPTKETIIRTICLVLALVNQILVATGHTTLPIDDAMVAELVSTLVTVVVALVNWWYNNSFTQKAIAADEYMKKLD